MRLTKNDMARVIVAALYNMKALPPADHFKVVSMARRSSVDELRDQHKRAVAAIESVRAKVSA